MEVNPITGVKVNHKVLDKRIDMSGTTFCHLTAIRPASRSNDEITSYVCRCNKCGNEIIVATENLFFYKTRSCGCTDFLNLSGGVFSNLTVIRQAGLRAMGTKGNMVRVWLCRCKCGNEITIPTNSLTTRHAKSCGCLRISQATKYTDPIDRKINRRLTIIKFRCYNKDYHDFKHYGGNGITVCDEWLADSQNFVNWFKSQPNWSLKYEVDRIDSTGPYAPWNCRLATRETQLINRSITHFIVVNGIKLTGTQWSHLLRLKHRSSLYSFLQSKGPEKTLAMIKERLALLGITKDNLHEYLQFEHFDPITEESDHV